MDIFQGKTWRYLAFTVAAYSSLSFLAPSLSQHTAQNPQNNNRPGIEDTIPKENPANRLEKELQKPEPVKQPDDKYGPQWQEQIRKKYRTELA